VRSQQLDHRSREVFCLAQLRDADQEREKEELSLRCSIITFNMKFIYLLSQRIQGTAVEIRKRISEFFIVCVSRKKRVFVFLSCIPISSFLRLYPVMPLYPPYKICLLLWGREVFPDPFVNIDPGPCQFLSHTLFPFLCSIDHHPDNILFLCLFLL
jgi:hypothetical protein